MQNEQAVPYEIPEAFRFEPFFKRGILWKDEPSEDSISAILTIEPFYFDMKYLTGNLDKEKQPWENPEVYLPIVFDKFIRVSEELTVLLKSRKAIDDKMSRAISFFILGLFWLNEQNVQSLNREDLGLKKLTLKPVNCEERLLFILQNPAQYHSFVQLEQLAEELTKIFYKQLAVSTFKNTKNPNIT